MKTFFQLINELYGKGSLKSIKQYHGSRAKSSGINYDRNRPDAWGDPDDNEDAEHLYHKAQAHKNQRQKSQKLIKLRGALNSKNSKKISAAKASLNRTKNKQGYHKSYWEK